ncbi:hypothetical protein HD554DRAFT_2039520 [Boletus coccyginus]|nr:hypothetical protein HD554DRAFT_2039520 [Boletus coccyginus]
MNAQTQNSLASTALLASLTYIPLLLSVLSFYPALFVTHPIQRFLLLLAPYWLAYRSARWYIRLAERSSPLYHPLGCLAQCCIWVFHWVITLYHAVFVTKYTLWTYLITIFCVGIMVVAEGMFYNLVTMGSLDTTHLGVYQKLRKIYGRGNASHELENDGLMTVPVSILGFGPAKVAASSKSGAQGLIIGELETSQNPPLTHLGTED